MKTKNPAPARTVNKFKALARDIVRHHLGSASKRIVHKSSGLTNFVFEVSHADGKFVVRISPEASRVDTFIKEQWAQHEARAAGVPVPQILEVGFEKIDFPYMISTSVEGSNALHHPERLAIIREMGRYAAVINKIKTKGFGRTFDWSANKLSFNKSYKEFLEAEFDYVAKLDVLEQHKLIGRPKRKQLEKIFEVASKLRAKPTLNHGDLRLKNVMVDAGGQIVAIIDWENSTSNIAPIWELAYALHDVGIDAKQAFLEGYGAKPKVIADAMPIAKAINVASYADAVAELAKQRKTKDLDMYRLRLDGTLDLYSI